jgi:hypothetical protein
VLSEKKILNETKSHNPPPPFQVNWSVPKMNPCLPSMIRLRVTFFYFFADQRVTICLPSLIVGFSESVFRKRTDNTMAKRKSTNNDLQNLTHKAKDRVTRPPLNTVVKIRYSGRVSSSIERDYNMAFFISDPLWPLDSDIRNKGWCEEL